MILNLAPRALAAVLAVGVLAPVTHMMVTARATSAEIGGPDRFLTSISTDKPIYRPGDTVFARGVMLHALKRTPLPGAVQPTIEIRGPKGDVVASGTSSTQDGVWGFSWQVPAESAGGEYTLRATYPWAGHPPAERKFDVRVFRAPRLKSQIVFLRDGYGPGDEVSATLDVKRAEGGIPEGARVTATAMVDGAEVARVVSTVDARGLCTVRFALPRQIARGEGALAFAIEDGGVVETAAKTLPILLQTVDLALYPEGGDLVAGLPARVYFEARTPAHKPADIAGEVVDRATGQVVAHFRSEHEGRGRFELTPERGVRYELRLTQPSGIRTRYPLPEAKSEGAILRSARDAFARGRLVELGVELAGLQRANVTLASREVQVASATVSGSGTVVLDPKDADGVLVATVWDEHGRPLAERLVFREPEKELAVELRTDKKSYVPGDRVKLTARTTQDGRPVSAVVGLTVTDDAVLEMIEKREQAPQLPVMVLLEPEVRELADAQVYLDPKNPKARLAVDLLLGTQGWRRFAFTHVPTFVAEHGDAALRVLALRNRTTVDFEEDMIEGELARPDMGAMLLPRGAAQGGRRVPAALPAMAPPAKAAPPPPMAHPMPRPAPVAQAIPLPSEKEKKEQAKKPMDLAGALARNRADRDLKQIAGGGRAHLRELGPRPMVFVREYAHPLRPDRKPGDREDFTETLYWNAGVRTDARTGEATVSFALNDGVTTFKAFANAFGQDGALGSASASLESIQPFYVEAKLPLEVTEGDLIRLPIALVNGTQSVLRNTVVKPQAQGNLKLGALEPLDLQPAQRVRRLLELRPGVGSKPFDLTLAVSAGDYADSVTRRLSVKPKGFPTQVAFGGLVGPTRPAQHEVTIPADVVPGSLKTHAAVYPTPLANMTESLAALIQQPSGCFEQTSSTTYPMTMAQQYFQTHTGVDPKLVESAREKLDYGYKRLVGFECPEKGYEWFGENPGHEALTAFGLLHFTDMKQVREVDANMLERTRAWLLRQRDGKGGFERKRRALHTWIEDKDTSNAYILWALMESGERDVAREVASLKEAAAASQNSYVVALAANVMALAGEPAEAKRLMDRLTAKQDKGGVVEGGTQSIVGSGGDALRIETTALATLAWLRDPAYAANVERAMTFLADSCKGGRYGSTQSTVLALRAIVAYDKARARPKAPGSLRVYVDDQPVGSWVKFDTSTQTALELPDLSGQLAPGPHRIEVRMEGGADMPYALSIDYNAVKPASSKETPVALSVELYRSQVSEGELVEAQALVTNKSGQRLPTVVAIIGLPGGLEPRHDQLKELVKKGTVDAYEVLGREVVLYWRGMEPNSRRTVPLSLVAAVPGTYTGPASRAYLYYTDEQKTWVDAMNITILPRAG